MDLNARVDVNFARVDVNFQTPINTKGHTKFQPNIPIQFGGMDLNARVDVNV